jgi:hypothetical protein
MGKGGDCHAETIAETGADEGNSAAIGRTYTTSHGGTEHGRTFKQQTIRGPRPKKEPVR